MKSSAIGGQNARLFPGMEEPEEDGQVKCSRKEGCYRSLGKKAPGHVLVIVNHQFEYEADLKKGNDVERIEQLFSAYGYNVHYGYNVNKENILGTVHRLSCQPDSGSLVCFISSHGDQTSLACPDGDSVQIIDILERANTKQLELCPKVFFFDTCRSKNGSLRGKGLPEPPTLNYYVGFSCLDTKTSKTGAQSCGVYFDEIIKTFEDGFPRPHEEPGKVRDLNHFMNKVHYAVTTKYHQVPIVRTTLVGKVFLQKPKLNEITPANTLDGAKRKYIFGVRGMPGLHS